MKRIILLIVSIVLILFGGITYSLFISNAKFITNQNLAKFIFNSEPLDHIELALTDLKPGETKDYLFSVSNNENENISDVTIEYQITIKTYHFMPLEIELYKIAMVNDEPRLILIGNCDETFSRDPVNNELICNMGAEQIEYAQKELVNYKLVVNFPSTSNDNVYAGLVDYIDLEIRSWQKV